MYEYDLSLSGIVNYGTYMAFIHGESYITLTNNILFIKLIGAFNEFGLKEVTEKIKLTVNNLNGQAFFIVVDDIDLTGATPEAFQELEILNQWLNSQNMIAKAIIINSPANLNIIKSRIPALKQQKLKVFQHKLDALDWFKTLKSSVRKN